MRICLQLLLIILGSFKLNAEPLSYPASDTIELHSVAIPLLKNHLRLTHNDSIKIVQLHKLAFRYIRLEQYDTALQYVNQGLTLAKDSKKYQLHLTYLYRYKGAVYYYLYNRKEAIAWFEQSKELASKNRFYLEEMQVCSNLGGMYIEENEFGKAEKNLLNTLKISKEHNYLTDDKALMGRRLLGSLYQKQNKNKEAKIIFEDLIKDCKKLNNQLILVSALTYYASHLREIKDYKQSEMYFYEAIALQKQDSSANSLTAIYAEMAKLFEQKGDFKKANKCKDSAYQLKIGEFSRQTKAEIAESEAKYNNYVLKSKLELENKKKIMLIAITIIIVLIGILAWLLYHFNQKKRESALVEQRNKAVLNALVEGEEKERVRLARDLHDGIVQEIAMVGRDLGSINEINFENRKLDIGLKIKNIVNEIRLISHSLMPHALTTLGLEPALKDLFRKNFEHSEIEYSLDVIGSLIPMNQRIEITLYRIAQELINNIIKHSNASEVNAQLIYKPNALVLIIEDNGIGLQQPASDGIGLANIESRLSLINGHFEYDGNNGTVSVIHVPL